MDTRCVFVQYLTFVGSDRIGRLWHITLIQPIYSDVWFWVINTLLKPLRTLILLFNTLEKNCILVMKVTEISHLIALIFNPKKKLCIKILARPKIALLTYGIFAFDVVSV